MLKYSLSTIKNNPSWKKRINKNRLQTNTSKIDGIAFCAGAYTQQGSKKLILNLTGGEGLPQV